MYKDLTKEKSAVAYYLVQFEDIFYDSDDFNRKKFACISAVDKCANYIGKMTGAMNRIRSNFIDCTDINDLDNLYYNILKKSRNYLVKE